MQDVPGGPNRQVPAFLDIFSFRRGDNTMELMLKVSKRGLVGLVRRPWSIARDLLAVLVLPLLALPVVANDVHAAGAPYFQNCQVTAVNKLDGMHLQMTARIFDPNGAVPATIASVVVTSPGGFTYNLKSSCQTNGVCSAITPSAATPSSELYTFTVTDTEGKTTSSSSYLQVGSAIPVIDAASMVATGPANNLTLSWSAPSYTGNLFYGATLRDDNGTTIFSSPVQQNTAVTGIALNASHTYQWWVQAFDQYSPPLSENASLTDHEALDPTSLNSDQPHFEYAKLYNRHKSDGTFVTQIVIKVVDPSGPLPGSLKSLAVTGPVPFSYTFDLGDPTVFDSSTQEFSKSIPDKPVDGVYTFTVTDANDHVATTYDYVASRDVPLIYAGTMQASGDPLQPMLSWGLPTDMNSPLYFYIYVYDDTDTTVWTSDITTNTAVQVPAGKLAAGASYSWQVRAYDSRYGTQWNRSDSQKITMTFDNATPYFTWYGVYYRHDPEGYWINLEAQVRDPDGTVPSTIQTLKVEGPNNFVYDFQPADYESADDEYWKILPGNPAPGVYTFTLTDADGHSAVSHAYLNPPQAIPLINPATLAVNSGPQGPIVSWSAIANHPGRLHYRLRVIDSQGIPVWSSSRSYWTAVTIPADKLVGSAYQFRVEATDDRDYPMYTGRSNTRYYPLTVPFVLPAPDLTGKWKTLKSKNLGKTITGTMLVKNIGDDNAGAFSIKCYISKNGVKLGKLLKTIKVKGGIQAGQNVVVPFSYKSKTSLIGSYIVAVLDAANSIPERNETNNKMAKKVK
jgi:hypothetical protein